MSEANEIVAEHWFVPLFDCEKVKNERKKVKRRERKKLGKIEGFFVFLLPRTSSGEKEKIVATVFHILEIACADANRILTIENAIPKYYKLHTLITTRLQRAIETNKPIEN